MMVLYFLAGAGKVRGESFTPFAPGGPPGQICAFRLERRAY
jgi:hypothetical protein